MWPVTPDIILSLFNIDEGEVPWVKGVFVLDNDESVKCSLTLFITQPVNLDNAYLELFNLDKYNSSDIEQYMPFGRVGYSSQEACIVFVLQDENNTLAALGDQNERATKTEVLEAENAKLRAENAELSAA